jgi:hypothetical protein
MNVRCNDLSRRAELSLPAPHFLCSRGCGGNLSTAAQKAPAALAAATANLIFEVSEDLNHHSHGDVNPDTADLTPQGLQRSQLMAPYLQQKVVSNNNVTAIYALDPMTHLLTTRGYPKFDRLLSTAHLMPLRKEEH